MMGQRPPQRQVNVLDVMKNLGRYIDDKAEGLERLQDAAQVISGLVQRNGELETFIMQKGLQVPAPGTVQGPGTAPFQPKEAKAADKGASAESESSTAKD